MNGQSKEERVLLQGANWKKSLTQRSVHTARVRLPLRQQDARIVHQCSIQQMKVKNSDTFIA